MNVRKSMEVLTEEFYDVCAWLRDLPLDGQPAEVAKVTATIHYPATAIILDENGEERTEEALVEVEVMKFADGMLHIHGPGVCTDVDMSALAEKRPAR